jgi:hypothetical protein
MIWVPSSLAPNRNFLLIDKCERLMLETGDPDTAVAFPDDDTLKASRCVGRVTYTRATGVVDELASSVWE